MLQAHSRSSTTPQKTQRSNSIINNKKLLQFRSSFFYTITPMFRCKQFSIDDTDATMKVGNDAVMLGAIARPKQQPQRILDIGTGCGILALMMAQRFLEAQIDAIDIDSQTVTVAASNFINSPWSSHLHARHITLQELASQPHTTYDLIISNPPYFSNSLRNQDPRKRLARHNDTLTLSILFSASHQLLTPAGVLAIILPSSDAQRAIDTATECHLHLCSRADICNHHDDPPKRTILQFGIQETEILIEKYRLRNSNNTYSAEYTEITSPFLL